jgi:prepilin-type N-terminal cleavage/methylation domain-containing protein
MKNAATKYSRGFTLIEIAVVITIAGLLLAGILRGYKVFVVQKQQVDLEVTYDVVKQAISSFRYVDPDPDNADATEMNGRYPCPASPTAAQGSANFGVEDCTTANGVVQVVGTGGRVVLIGTVPTATLGISSAHMVDPFKNRLTYAVTRELTTANALSDPSLAGGIQVSPTISGTPITNAEFVLISHGRTGAGSYTIEGVVHPSVCGNDDRGDTENCDGDAIFSELQMALADTPDFSDDKLAFNLENTAVNAVCAAGEYMVSITNGIPDCRTLSSLSCAAGEVLTAIDSNGNPVCVNLQDYILTTLTSAGLVGSSCSSGQVVQGVQSDGALNCVTDATGGGGGGGSSNVTCPAGYTARDGQCWTRMEMCDNYGVNCPGG